MKNTFFYNYKVPINVILSNGYDILAVSRTQEIVICHDLSPTTVTDSCGFYRDLISEDIAYTTMNEKIGRPEIIVEVGVKVWQKKILPWSSSRRCMGYRRR
jgi:hypothetical protein